MGSEDSGETVYRSPNLMMSQSLLPSVRMSLGAEAPSPFSVGMKVTLLLPLCSPFHYMANGRGNSQQHMAEALQQCGGPSEELPEGQRQETVR